MPAVLHPLIIHFPVALLLTASLALLWINFRPKHALTLQGFVNGAFGFGYAGLVMAVATGLYDLQASPKTLARDGWVLLTVLHLACGVLLLVVYGFLLYRRFLLPGQAASPSTKPPLLPDTGSNLQTEIRSSQTLKTRLDRITLILAITGVILLVVAAWLGGMLVYDYRVGVQ
jgi:uncharacterized membrane protein